MQFREKLSKLSWMLLESVKDATMANVSSAVRGNQLKVDVDQLEKLLVLLSASIDEGFHRAHKTFLNRSCEIFNEMKLSESMPALTAKKK